MDGVNKLYHDFSKAFTEVHKSTTSGTEVQRRANEKWAQMKAQVKAGDMGPYNEEMTRLKHLKDSIKAKSSITAFFARQVTTKKPSLRVSSESDPDGRPTQERKEDEKVVSPGPSQSHDSEKKPGTKINENQNSRYKSHRTPAQDSLTLEINELRASILHLQATPMMTKEILDSVRSKKKELEKKEMKLKALKAGVVRSQTLYNKKKGMLKRAAEKLEEDKELER